MGKKIGASLAAIVFVTPLFAQDPGALQKLFIEAEYFFVQEDYSDALSYYIQIYDEVPQNANIAYRIGVCYLNIPGQKDLSIKYLKAAAGNMSAKYREGTIKQKSAPFDALYELAMAYKIDYQFDKAKETFAEYMSTLSPSDRDNRDFVNLQIKSCDIATDLIANPVSFKEENMGPVINDERSDFNPVISDDGMSFAFMISMKFYDAIMLSKKINNTWSTPVNITPELQSDGDMYISCLTSGGNTLYLSKDDNFNSDIFTCTFDGIRWGKAESLNKNINTKYWETHGFVSEDGEQLVFASDRPGGFGGLDLYISRRISGDWGPPVNLGPAINTPFNEDRPFLINNGHTLYFSSQGHQNIGGYDLFRSELKPDRGWTAAENLGYPLNTPDDNIFFMPVSDRRSGYYSVYKPSEGFGREDIYLITFDK